MAVGYVSGGGNEFDLISGCISGHHTAVKCTEKEKQNAKRREDIRDNYNQCPL
jgi:hypothetical protein